MLTTSAPYFNDKGEEVMLLTYSDGHTDECKYLRKGRDF